MSKPKIRWRRGKPYLVVDTRPSKRMRSAKSRHAKLLKVQKRKPARRPREQPALEQCNPKLPSCSIEELAKVIGEGEKIGNGSREIG